jgi:hypothetical protein
MKNNQMDDEAAQKKRGIASADKIGFFERIRMGNIDDPSSEAYKKLGAGRGRSIPKASKIPYTETDDAKNLDKAAMREKSEVTDERDAREAEYASLPRKTPPRTRKAPIVTKEQMKKKGFDNLRDYLNAERNLKRRDNFASEAQKRLFATGARGTQTEGSAGEAEARAVAEMRRKAAMPGSKEDMERDAREQATSGGMKKTPVNNKAEEKSQKTERPGLIRRTIAALGGVKLPQADYGTKSKEDDEKPVARSKPVSTAARIAAANQGYKKGGNVESKLMGKEGRGMAKATMQKVASKAVKGHESRMHKMKSGGTVSSASKRADGIAMKGKTRGRMM